MWSTDNHESSVGNERIVIAGVPWLYSSLFWTAHHIACEMPVKIDVQWNRCKSD